MIEPIKPFRISETTIQGPSNLDLMDKLNEVIEFLNNLENKDQ